eukprot:Gb_27712 [translate_table: standard]
MNNTERERVTTMNDYGKRKQSDVALDAKLLVPQSLATLPIMHALCSVYGCGVIVSQNVVVWIEKMHLVVKVLETDGRGALAEVVRSKHLVTDSLHGQETSSSREKETKEAWRKKGKSIADEGLDTQRTSQAQIQSITVDELLSKAVRSGHSPELENKLGRFIIPPESEISPCSTDSHVQIGTHRFTFDRVYGSTGHPSGEIFEQCVAPLVDSFFQGYNGTVLAYGQTGSGKTYTMGTGQTVGGWKEGIIPKVMHRIFTKIHNVKNSAVFQLKVSFIQLSLSNDIPEELLDGTGYAAGWSSSGYLAKFLDKDLNFSPKYPSLDSAVGLVPVPFAADSDFHVSPLCLLFFHWLSPHFLLNLNYGLLPTCPCTNSFCHLFPG